ncbi:hypothetical protein [Sulfitobacter sp. HGT1]|uniref:hypothetical protein n=1 Tax=Sulfitobacter sp. HGT1 TaxID=2735435 RepID=UPI0015933924|nr:hypothetical protein [Sulfitobacter sp. HGT1]
MKLDLLITGCGRSGTQYLTEVLAAAGIRTSHEKRFTVFGPENVEGPQCEASWYAAPFLSHLSPKTRILHLVRDPAAVVKSFHRIGLCAPKIRHHVTAGQPLAEVLARTTLKPLRLLERIRYVHAHRDLLERATTCLEPAQEVDRLWQYWGQWNGIVEDFLLRAPNPHLRLRLEELDEKLPELAAFLEVDLMLQARPAANTKPFYRRRPIAWTPIPHAVRARAERYGYIPHV